MKKKNLRLISIFLALCLLCSLLPLGAAADKLEAAETPSVPKASSIYEFEGRRYQFFHSDYIDTVNSWEDAAAYCRSLGGHLATIHSQEENDFLYQSMLDSGYTSAYFGYSDAAEEGVWVWADGSPSDYENWAAGEPNAQSYNEDYAMFYWKYPDGTWNDGDFVFNAGSGELVFICEWDEESISSSPAESPSEERHFDFNRDAFRFTNSYESFFTGLELMQSVDYLIKSSRLFQYASGLFNPALPYLNSALLDESSDKLHYNLSPDKIQQLLAPYEPRVRTVIQNALADRWGGSCDGMIRAAMIRYLYPERIPVGQIDSSAGCIHDLHSPNGDTNVEDLVNYYYLTQFLPLYKHYQSNQFTHYQLNYDQDLASIVASLKENQPVFAALQGHAILLLEIENETTDYYTVSVYDPNETQKQYLKLYKDPYISSEGLRYPKVSYETFHYIQTYILPQDIEFVDVHNYFGFDNFEIYSDYNDEFVILKDDLGFSLRYKTVFIRAENGKLVEASTGVQVYHSSDDADSGSGQMQLVFPQQADSDSDIFTLEVTSGGVSDVEILLNDTLLSFSASGPLTLTYDEASRTVDVAADEAVDVNLMFTQNTVSESWPWHSWAVDTTGTTTFHAELTDEGLQMRGDGLTEANYAVENADTSAVTGGTVSQKPDSKTGMVSVLLQSDASAPEGALREVSPPAGRAARIWAAFRSGIDRLAGSGHLPLLLGCIAIALVCIVLIFRLAVPVRVRGKVTRSGGAPAAGVCVTLTRKGQTIAQTTTDAKGRFKLKVHRGRYELTAAGTTVLGQPLRKTVPIKAPAKKLNIGL